MRRLDGSGQVALEKILEALDQNLQGMGLQNEATDNFAGLNKDPPFFWKIKFVEFRIFLVDP